MEDVTEGPEGQAATEAPPVADVNVTEPAEAPVSDEPTYTVKVSGEEVQVTQSELLAGYSRTGDYTRKMQELAEQRKSYAEGIAIQEALSKDPNWAMQTIANHYGVQMQTPQTEPVPANSTDPWGDESQEQDPRIQALESEIAQLRSSIERDHTESQIAQLEAQDPNFDRDLLYSTALKHQVNDVGTAYKLMQADILAEQLRQREESESQVQAQKEMASTVHSGPARSTNASASNGEAPKTIEEAWLMSRNS